MLDILICDDNQDYLNILKNEIRNIIFKSEYSDLEFRIQAFTTSKDAEEFIREKIPEVSFLDIDMPGATGFDLAKQITERDKEAKIVFVTNFDNYVYSSFAFRPLRFIRKSHINEELDEAISVALQDRLCEKATLTLSSKYNCLQIFYSDIEYVESMRNYVSIVMSNGEKYVYRCSMAQMEEKLSGFDFVRVHSAYIVNIKKVMRLYKDHITLKNGQSVGLSRKYADSAKKLFVKYMRG